MSYSNSLKSPFIYGRFLGGLSLGSGAGFVLLATLIVALSGSNSRAVDASHPMRVTKVESAYDDVKFDVENAIVDAGLKIIYRGNIGQMLERTSGAVVAKGKAYKKVYDNAEFFLFCSAPNSHATMNADPRNLGLCPYKLYVYSLAGEKETTYVGYRSPQIIGSPGSQKALKGLDAFLAGLLKSVVE